MPKADTESVTLTLGALRQLYAELDAQGAEINRLCGQLAATQADRDAARAELAAMVGVGRRWQWDGESGAWIEEAPGTRALQRPPPLDLGPVADPWPASGQKG